MWRHYVYQHRRCDTGAVFYVGKGSVRARRKSVDYERAHCRDNRNAWWQRVVAKHGLGVEIVASFPTDTAAQEFEKELIAQYGRASLVNLTDGGDGHAGIATSAEVRHKRSMNARGSRSQAWVQSIRRARHKGGNGGVVKRGDKLPLSWRENISKAVTGENNHRHGKPSARRKAVIDKASGAIYPSITHAAAAFGLRVQRLHNMLTGFRPNSTTMRFAA